MTPTGSQYQEKPTAGSGLGRRLLFSSGTELVCPTLEFSLPPFIPPSGEMPHFQPPSSPSSCYHSPPASCLPQLVAWTGGLRSMGQAPWVFQGDKGSI